MALRQDTVRLLIADDVGIGKTIEAGLIAAELLAQGDAQRLAVLCSPGAGRAVAARAARASSASTPSWCSPAPSSGLERGLMLNESLFDRYPHVIVSTDFIKSDRRRHEFLLPLPRARHRRRGPQQRRRRRRRAARAATSATSCCATSPPTRAGTSSSSPPPRTPATTTAFANLIGLLDPDLGHRRPGQPTAAASCSPGTSCSAAAPTSAATSTRTPRSPATAQTRDVPYTLSPGLPRPLRRRPRLRPRAGPRRRRRHAAARVRWWSVLALLRALASSPRAAAATLRTRAANAEAADVAEADALGRAAVLDSADDESLEGIDATPGALTPTPTTPTTAPTPAHERRRLLELRPPRRRARRARAGPQARRAHHSRSRSCSPTATTPIVFCRFIDTADYVAEHLADALGTKRRPSRSSASPAQLPPAERRAPRRRAHRHRRPPRPGRHRLPVRGRQPAGRASQAVVHYDLAWNPTRHEQREGRVDRFGQRQRRRPRRHPLRRGQRHRRHRPRRPDPPAPAIAKATGVAVPVPGDGQALVDALAEGLLLRGAGRRDQLTLDLGLDAAHRRRSTRAWESAAEKEKASRTRTPSTPSSPRRSPPRSTRSAPPSARTATSSTFLADTLRALGATVTPTDDGFTAVTATLPLGAARQPARRARATRCRSTAEPPAAAAHAVLARTDPTVEALARYVLDERPRPRRRPGASGRPAAPASCAPARSAPAPPCCWSGFRFHLDLPDRDGVRQLVAEDARVLAFEGAPNSAVWLADDAGRGAARRATPDGQRARRPGSRAR